MNPKNIHKYEKAHEDIKRNFCPLLFSFYRGCIDSGFSNIQALHLTNSYMIGILNRPPLPISNEDIDENEPEFDE